MANEFVTRTGLIVSGSTYLPAATSASKGYILSFDTSTKEVYYMSTSSVTVTVPGSDTQVIYNNGGSFGASSNFVFSGSNVGIGTTSPGFKLDVQGSAGNIARITDGTSHFLFYAGSGLNEIATTGPFLFTVSGSEKMRITTAGNVGIGTTSPLTTLEVRTSLNSTIPPLSGVPDASTTLLIGNTGTNGVLAIGHDNAGHPWLQGRSVLAGQSPEDILINPLGGNVGIGTTSPTTKLEVIGEGSGSVKMGSTGFGGDWVGISLSGNLNTSDYNLLSSATNASFYLNRPTGGDMLFRHNNVDQMIIKSAGNVGIGTTSPNARLDVSGSVLISGSLTVSGSSTFTNIGPAVFTGSITQNASTASFGGLVGIGTTTPAFTLDVNGTGRFNDIRLNDGRSLSSTSGGTSYVVLSPNNGNITLNAYDNTKGINVQLGAGNVIMSVTGSNVGIGTTSPSRKLHVTSGAGIAQFQSNTTSGTVYFGDTNSSVIDNQGIGSRGNDIAIAAGGFDRFTVTSGGNVGIGTTTPGSKLEVAGTNPFVRINNSSTSDSGIKISYGNSDIHGLHLLYNPSSAISYIDNTYPTSSGQVYGDMYFRQNAGGTMASRIVIKAESGNVGIGTTSPTNKLQVAGGVTATSFTGSFSGSVSAPGSTTQIVYNNGGTLAADSGLVYSGSNVGIGTASPTSALTINGTEPYIRLERSGVPTWEIRQNFPLTEYGFQIVNVTSGSIPFFVGNSNNIGIGTTSPTAKLDVTGNSKFVAGFSSYTTDGLFNANALPGVYVDTPGGSRGTYIGYRDFGGGQYYGRIGVRGSVDWSLGIGNSAGTSFSIGLNNNAATDYITISSGSGNVGIGTTAPVTTLDVRGTLTVSGSGGDLAVFATNGTNYTTITSTGNLSFNTSTSLGLLWSPASLKFEGQTQGVTIRPYAANYVSFTVAGAAGQTANLQEWQANGGLQYSVVDATGSFGIGTSTPASKLHVSGASATIRVDDIAAGNPGFEIMSGGSTQASLISNTTSGNTTLLVPAGSLTLRAAVGNVFITGSTFQTGSGTITGDLTVGGTITAQKLNVQQVTSSVIYSSGSNIFGNDITNTQTFTGSIQATGSTHYLLGDVGIGTTSPISGQGTPLTLASPTGFVGLTLSGSGAYSHLWQLYASGDGGSNKFFGIYDSTNAIYRLVTTSAGNVGIGITAPTAKIHTGPGNWASDPAAKIYSGAAINTSGSDIATGRVFFQGYDFSGTDTVGINNETNRLVLFNYTDGRYLQIWDHAGNTSLVPDAGNVGIGTTNPAAKLTVSGTGVETHINNGDTNALVLGGFSSGRHFIKSINLGVALTPLTLQASSFNFDTGTVGIGTTSPSNILDIQTNQVGGYNGISINSTGSNANQAGLRLAAGDGSTNRASRIDFVNNVASATVPRWTLINDYNQNGTNDFRFILSDTSTSALTLLQSGNVGIGTTNPTAKLDVSAGTNLNLGVQQLSLNNFSNDGIGITFSRTSSDDDLAALGVVESDKLGLFSRSGIIFATSGSSTYSATSEVMRIAENGNVGIGTTSPNAKLEVSGNIYTTSNTNFLLFGTNSAVNPYIQGASDNSLYIGNNNTSRIFISGSGNVGIGTTSPSYTLTVGKQEASDNTDYALAVLRHGTGVSPGTWTSQPAILISDQTNNGPGTVDTTGLFSMQLGRFDYTDTDATNASLINITYDGTLGPFRVDGKGNTWIGYNRASVPTNSGAFGLLVRGGASIGSNYQATTPPSNGAIIEGNVGIGTTNPVSKLDVEGGTLTVGSETTYAARFTNGAGTKPITIGSDTSYAYIQSWSSGPLVINSQGNNVLFPNTSINVGIGTYSPTATLQISNTSSGNAFSMIGSNSKEFVSISYLGYIRTRASDTNGANMHFVDNGNTKRMEMGVTTTSMDWYSDALASTFLTFQHSTGNIGIGTSSPTQRLHVSGAIAIEAESTTTKYSTTFSGSLTTNTNIASIPTGSFKAAFFDYYVASGSVNMRAGTVMSVHNNSTSRYTDTSTGDIGNTSAVDFSTSIVAGSLVLTANISSGTWEVKTAYRAL